MVVVVSAQGDTTDDLIAKAAEINDKALQAGDGYAAVHRRADFRSRCWPWPSSSMGYPVVSLTGLAGGLRHQLGTYGDARIKRVSTGAHLSRSWTSSSIVVVTGFQGINQLWRYHHPGPGRLGHQRGGHWPPRMHADLCQIYTDVDGVYTADPRQVQGCAGSSARSPTTRCWSWRPWAPRCSTTARWRWPSSTTLSWRSSPALPGEARYHSQGGCKQRGKNARQRGSAGQQHCPYLASSGLAG